MRFSARILHILGWSVNITVPDYPKCIVCVAPHTSNLDFFIGKLAYASVGRRAGFMMKSTWFFPPLSWILKSMGGIPVERSKHSTSLVETMIRKFETASNLVVAITPEGTRSRVSTWRTGFLRIAYNANIPIVLGIIDFATKTVSITTTFHPTGNVETDMADIKRFYRASRATGRHPQNFTTE